MNLFSAGPLHSNMRLRTLENLISCIQCLQVCYEIVPALKMGFVAAGKALVMWIFRQGFEVVFLFLCSVLEQLHLFFLHED